MSDAVSLVSEKAPAAEAPAPRFDFPTWLPPMLVKELRQGLRQRGFVGGLIIVQAVLLIVFISGFVGETGNGSSRSMIDGFFWSVMGGVLLLGAPLRALTGLSAELESRTMDLLLLTRLDAWRIVWGKWVSLMAQTILLAVTLLPYAVVRYFFGAVDLVGDFAIIAGMLAGGAVLTGVGLWASGLPRALRFLVVIVTVMAVMSNMGGMIFGLRRSPFSFGAGSASDIWLAWTLGLWGGALALFYFLSLAVRWFAPPAENHAILPRLMPLGMAAPAPLLALCGRPEAAGAQALAAGVTLGLVAAIELAGTRELMAIHLRVWRARGRGLRRVAPLLLPGWPSACAWLAVMTALAVAAWLIADLSLAKDLHAAEVAWLAVLGWAGLVFPCTLVALPPTAGRVSGFIYFSLHGILGVFSVLSGNAGLSRMAPKPMWFFDWLSHATPTASFWHALVEWGKPSELPAVGLGQVIGVAVTIALMLFLGRPYWAQVRIMGHDAARTEAAK